MSDVVKFLSGDQSKAEDPNQVGLEAGQILFGLSRQVVSTKFKNLVKIGLVELIEEEKRYKLSYLDASVAMLIPIETLRKINNALS